MLVLKLEQENTNTQIKLLMTPIADMAKNAAYMITIAFVGTVFTAQIKLRSHSKFLMIILTDCMCIL